MGGLQRGSTGGAEGPDVADGRLTEKAAVFAIELAGAFVADFEGGAGGVEAVHEHALARCLQPELLLILKRTHRSERAKMMMERGDSHACHFCEIFDAQRLCEIRTHPRDCFCCAMALISERGDGSKASALRSAQNSIDDFALDQVAEKWNVLRSVQQIYETAASVEELGCGLAGGHGRICGGRLRRMNLFPAQEFSNHGHFELEYESEIGHLFAGFNHVADDGQIERSEQIARFIEDKSFSGEGGSLAALRDNGEAWLVCGGGWRRWGSSAGKEQAGNISYQPLLRANERGNFARQLLAQFARSSWRGNGIYACF